MPPGFGVVAMSSMRQETQTQAPVAGLATSGRVAKWYLLVCVVPFLLSWLLPLALLRAGRDEEANAGLLAAAWLVPWLIGAVGLIVCVRRFSEERAARASGARGWNSWAGVIAVLSVVSVGAGIAMFAWLQSLGDPNEVGPETKVGSVVYSDQFVVEVVSVRCSQRYCEVSERVKNLGGADETFMCEDTSGRTTEGEEVGAGSLGLVGSVPGCDITQTYPVGIWVPLTVNLFGVDGHGLQSVTQPSGATVVLPPAAR